MATVIIAKNQTSVALTLGEIPIPDNEIPASGQVRLTDYASISEILEDFDISAYIESGQMIINDGTSDLTAEQSANYTSPVLSRNDLGADITKNSFSSSLNPTLGNDISQGYEVGSAWINIATKEAFICTDSSTGIASWSSTTSSEGSSSKRLSDFISYGPTEGFASVTCREVLGGFFPTSVTWYVDDTKAKKIVRKIITRTGGSATVMTPTPIVWELFDNDGLTVIATISDAITWSPFETIRKRTYS